MTPKNRLPKNKGLAPNLYSQKKGGSVYYTYRHPVTKKRHGLGQDKAKALAAAKRLNILLMPTNELVAKVTGAVTLRDHVDWFFENIIPHRDYAQNTMEMYQIRARQLVTELGNATVSDISVIDISRLMESMTPRPAQQFRQVASDIFKTAMGRGLIDVNPGEMAIKPISRKTRKRLSKKQFDLIYEHAPQWLKNAMKLALFSLQRRDDLVNMRFDTIKDDCLYVIQGKTKKHDTGYLEIKIGPKLAEIISNCRDDIASPYLIHRRPDRKTKRNVQNHWTQVSKAMVTRSFSAIVDNLEEFSGMPKNERPTFHEIRALGERVYQKAGIDPQKIGGWASEKMMKNYDSGHEDIRWIHVKSL